MLCVNWERQWAGALGRQVLAANDDEAYGIAKRIANEKYPDRDGWEHKIAVEEILGIEFLECCADAYIAATQKENV